MPTNAAAGDPTSVAVDLSLEKSLLEQAEAALKISDFDTARARAKEVVEKLLARPETDQGGEWAELLYMTGKAVWSAQDARTALLAFENVVDVLSRTLPEDHPRLQRMRMNVAVMLAFLGDLHRARALQEQALEIRLRTVPEYHPEVQTARGNLAAMHASLGDLLRAQALQEQVLEVCSRTLEADHVEVQRARANLATTLSKQGDLLGARELQEQVLDAFSRTLSTDHFDLQTVRGNLAATLLSLGDLPGALALQEQVLEVSSRTLPADSPELQVARGNLATTLRSLGDLPGARVLQEQVLESFSQTLPTDHPDLQWARLQLAVTMVRQMNERFASGAEDEARVLDLVEVHRCRELILARSKALLDAARIVRLTTSVREATELCEGLAEGLNPSVSLAAGCGVLDPMPDLEAPSFELSESTRCGGLSATTLMRYAARSPAYLGLRDDLREQVDALAKLAQQGTTTPEFQAALARRDATQRELVGLARERSGGQAAGLECDADALAAVLQPGQAAVGVRRYNRWLFEGSKELSTASLCAFVVRRISATTEPKGPAASLTLVELGPIEPIEQAVRAWRDALGVARDDAIAAATNHLEQVHGRGAELRKLIFDPLLPALDGVDHVILALDDVLQLVAIDALPLDSSDDPQAASQPSQLVGDRWRIEIRCTLWELLAPTSRPSGPNTLLALGGAAFDAQPLSPSAEEVAAVEASARPSPKVASILRGGAWEHGFSPLPYSALEIRDVVALHADSLGSPTVLPSTFEAEPHPALVLEGPKASRAGLSELAPKARWLHVATHGWFAPESIRSWNDPGPLDQHSGLGQRLSGEEQIRGMSPMLLCGLALAGANLPEDAVGRLPGLITAEELAALDLTNCNLVVLSACETNVGLRRAGQGMASLQMALQMAGARSAITSLWKVPDRATRELMLDFYRRLWVEGKPVWQALWEAKQTLREAKDPSGRPIYTTRDWAAWVLTGEQQ